jgi:tetratricopeptide (TPR) repeat protein
MMAQVARNMDDVEVLVSASRRLFRLNPNHGEGYGQLGDALSDLKYYLPAITTLRKALEIRRREPVQYSCSLTYTAADRPFSGF